MSDEPRAIQLPRVVALILCDIAYADRISGAVSLIGLVDLVRARSFPTAPSPLAVVVDLTDGVGRIPLSIKVIRTTAEELDGELVSTSDVAVVTFQEPRLIRRAIFRFRELSFPVPGEYRFILESGEAVLQDRRLLAGPMS